MQVAPTWIEMSLRMWIGLQILLWRPQSTLEDCLIGAGLELRASPNVILEGLDRDPPTPANGYRWHLACLQQGVHLRPRNLQLVCDLFRLEQENLPDITSARSVVCLKHSRKPTPDRSSLWDRYLCCGACHQ